MIHIDYETKSHYTVIGPDKGPLLPTTEYV